MLVGSTIFELLKRDMNYMVLMDFILDMKSTSISG
jgi:hypothetical protein